ncbi:acetyl esterase/lipase [Haloferula luteola]|uniref:Acetyl esterase/lipase n=1 Tax=Haloferula luteola TaxID=595692 RepID=A0A840V6W2_9BACT|nr:alpha/beta hydrolase [Haloferula luteola]MBB5352776.1 acetyl esterase/lipase [Haloferula luteola]
MMRLIFGLMLMVVSAAWGDWQPLWPGDAPGAARPAAGTERQDGGHWTDIEQPEYFLYPAPKEKRTGQGVVIFPGGGYTVLAMDHEGHQLAQWLNERGISAMVVKYRVTGNDALGYGYPVPFLDARRAIRTMRSLAGTLGVKSVGVMGSSAGGHLASTCATRFADTFDQETSDAIDAQNCRPDFAVLIYPVITMGPETHVGSKRRLLGENPTEEKMEALSTERQVSGATPPCFLLTTSDDMVDCRNSLRFAEACKAAGVPASLHLFEEGGHGYGLKGKGELQQWPGLLEAWLKRQSEKHL